MIAGRQVGAEDELMTRTIAVALAACILQACSITLPVQGRVQNSTETFTGTATGYLDRSGNLRITSTKGTVCSGDFVYTSSSHGEGVFSCDDGRSGPFQFASTGMRGTGYGDLGGQRFTFTFGG